MRNIQARYHTVVFRGIAAIVACVFLLGNLWTFVHYITVRHATCPEHGELVHVENSPTSVLQNHVTSVRNDDTITLRTASVFSFGHKHDHCYIYFSSRERIGLIPDSSLRAPFVSEGKVLPTAEGHEQPTKVARYHLAPKNSPPPA